jgi:ataxia telangiectasia mutated family protein
VYYQFAVFAERQYQEILKSPDTLRYKLYFDRKQKEVSKRRAALREAQGTQSHQQAARDLRKSESVFKEDQHRYNQHTHTLASFREQAIDMLSLCMSVSDEFDEESIMRFISLWFANFEEVGIYGALRPAVERIASRKFVFMAHQLSARLSSREASPSATQATPTEKIDAADSREGQSVLKNLILRMCREHPFHSLYQVYCLRPMSDHSTSQNRRQSGRVEAEASSQAHRESAASEIFSILRGDSESRERAMAVEKLCHASLQWATHPIKKAYGDKPKGAPHPVPDSLLIRKIRNLRVPVTTARTPLDPTMRYDNCVWVTRYEPTFETAGGVNLPKISVCLGSDGAQYKQLVSRTSSHPDMSVG